MSVELEQNDKMNRAAVWLGAAMTIVSFVVAVLLWTLPTLTRGDVSGERLGLPFSGVGACAMTGAGLLIASIGYLAVRRGRRHRAPSGPHRHIPVS